MLDYKYGLIIKDIEEEEELLIPENKNQIMSLKALNIWKKHLIDLFLFVNLYDKNILPLLKVISKDIKVPNFYSIIIYPIFNGGNETERKIVFSFYNILLSSGKYDALNFLIDGIEYGYENAYKRYKGNIKWNEIEMLMVSDSLVFVCMNELSIFLFKRRILKDSMLFVNGVPFDLNELSPNKLMSSIYSYSCKFYQNLISKFEINFKTNIKDIFENNFVIINNIEVKKDNEKEEYVKFSELNHTAQFSILNILNNTKVIFTKGEKSHVPIFLLDQNNKEISVLYKQYISCNIKYNISINQVPIKSLNALLDYDFVPSNAKIIIGGRIFNHIPDLDNFIYLVSSAKNCFGFDICEYSHFQCIYLYFWRSSQFANKIERKNHLKNNKYSIHVSKGNLCCEVSSNHLNVKFPYIIKILQYLLSKNVISLHFVHNLINLNKKINKIPDHLKYKYYFIYDENYMDVNQSYELIYPENWRLLKRNDNYILERLVISGYIQNSKYFQVGCQLRKLRKDNGYFMVELPFGKYKTKFVQKHLYIVDSLISLPNRFFANECHEKIKNKPDFKLNILTFITSFSQINQTKTMMNSITKNTNQTIKFWIISKFIYDFQYFNTEFLSPTINEDLNLDFNQQLYLSKLLNLDIYFPPTIKNILFSAPWVIWRGNASCFLSLNMLNSTIALPFISTNNSFLSSKDVVGLRDRPYHSTFIFFVDLYKWVYFNSHSILLNIIQKNKFKTYDDLINIAQLHIQMMTIPEEIVFCNVYSDTFLEN